MIKCNKALGEIIERKRRYFTPDEMETMSVSHGKLVVFEEMEEQGRLVTLPCNVGDMAYYIRGTTIYGDTVERIVIDGLDNQIALNANPNRTYTFCDVGSKLFFTYAEAEAALKGRVE